MNIEFYNYEEDETDVYVSKETLAGSTFHIAIENDDGCEAIRIYMSPSEVQGFINKLQRSLNEWDA